MIFIDFHPLSPFVVVVFFNVFSVFFTALMVFTAFLAFFTVFTVFTVFSCLSLFLTVFQHCQLLLTFSHHFTVISQFSTILNRCYHPQTQRDSWSPVCGIFTLLKPSPHQQLKLQFYLVYPSFTESRNIHNQLKYLRHPVLVCPCLLTSG